MERRGDGLLLPSGENSLSLRQLAGFLLSLVLLEANPGMVPSAYREWCLPEVELLLLFLLDFLYTVEAVEALTFLSDARF